MKMRLQYKVPILILLVMLFIGVATGAIMIYLQRQAGEYEFKQTATGLAGAVQGSLEEYMLEPGVEHGQAIGPAVSGLVKEELVNDVVIYQVDGSILASGSGQSTGEGTMDEAIQNVLSSGEALTELRSGRTELSVVTPIRNRIECRESCHECCCLTGDSIPAGRGYTVRNLNDLRQRGTQFTSPYRPVEA